MGEVRDIVWLGEVAGVVIMAFLYVKSRLPKQTIEQQGELIVALRNRLDGLDEENKVLREQHVSNERAIAKLEGQIKVYKELPLQEIARSLKILENLPEHFDNQTNSIMGAIRNINIKEQHVDTQFVGKENVSSKS